MNESEKSKIGSDNAMMRNNERRIKSSNQYRKQLMRIQKYVGGDCVNILGENYFF